MYLNQEEASTRKEEELAALLRNYNHRKQDVDTLAWLGRNPVLQRLS